MKSTRIEVRDKKEMYDAVAEGVKSDVRDLGISSVDDVHFVKVYTLRGELKKKDAEKIARDLLADPVSQEFDSDNGFLAEDRSDTYVVEVAYNPGVMDPVEESVKKAVNDMGISGVKDISTSRKYVLIGNIPDRDIEMITERLLYNKIIEHVVSDEREERPQLKPYRFRRIEIDILGADDSELMRLSSEGQLYLSLKEMKAIKRYFRGLKRNPTDCELETLAQTWSEHCKHKTMMGAIEYEDGYIDNLLKETVMKVTRELDKPWCVSVFKDNAGIIRFDEENDICFKVETHNHPSALEPYGGAETGIGGVIRDPMGTGRGARPIINTDIFCFGMPDMPQSDVPKGALHPKRVMKGVVSGVRDYGNKMGIPTVNGAVCFDERYTGNPLVFCGNVGIMPRKYSSKKISPGELIVAVGGRTGRDGIHGATFSSAELTHESESISSTAVQIGNPITEKKVLDTLIKARDMDLYTALTDCGAGGFSSAVGEMGEETGAEVHLEKAPLKYKGLKPWEIWVSEAQERMVLSVKPSRLNKLMKVFRQENVEATVIGKFTKTGKLRIYYKEHEVADLDMSFLHDGLPGTARKAVWKGPGEDRNVLPPQKKDYTADLLEILSSWNVCSKEWIIRQYDHEVQGGSVLKPLVGPGNDGPSDASVNRPLLDSDRGIVLSNGINPSYGDIDPYWMAASAIDEALRQIICTGGDIDRTALLDNFCWGNTERPEQLGGLVRASRACYDMASVFGTPFISGKDSLNNEFNTGRGTVSIPPTLLISAVSVIDDVGKTISSDIKARGNSIYVVGKTYQELGGSRYLLVNDKNGGVVPRVRPERSLKTMRKLSLAISKGLIRSAHDCSEGGLAVAVAEMLFAGSLGAEISLADVPRTASIDRDDVILFSESNSRFIVEVPADKDDEFKKTMKGVPAGRIGEVNATASMRIMGLNGSCVARAGLKRMKNSWKKPFRKLMHEKS
ncbi:MAG: phosphoribosylformylglycinamidine synthase subunit PurL [Candidatus Omnitrophica bacterium]|nr:phosphoribosylformylglycinamidine synthase subunit PurL [Candidatus Omnitrophota bacterium]